MHSFRLILTRLLLVLGLGLLPVWAAAQQPAAPTAPAPAAAATDAKTIKMGSVVQLNSGGPKMTVVGLSDAVVRAQWYNTNNFIYITADFPPSALKLATDDEDEDEDDEDEDEDDE